MGTEGLVVMMGSNCRSKWTADSPLKNLMCVDFVKLMVGEDENASELLCVCYVIRTMVYSTTWHSGLRWTHTNPIPFSENL